MPPPSTVPCATSSRNRHAQDLFRELAASGAQVERFAVQAPSLDEIFIRTVAGDPRAEAVR